MQIPGIGLVSAKENCEKYQSPFQYNECLARQAPGPAARSLRGGGTGGADPETTVPSRRRHVGSGAESRSGLALQRRDRGRVRAVIDPWSGARSVTADKKRRR
ncbi:MAG: hypothetical protein CTY25_02905 [Methylobacterium sp.]|nr:MAG: hypothetical protein CTY25_02905 [Methylobacterium sp.]